MGAGGAVLGIEVGSSVLAVAGVAVAGCVLAFLMPEILLALLVTVGGFKAALYKAGGHEDLTAMLRHLHKQPALRLVCGRNAATWARREFSLERFYVELGAALNKAARTNVHS